SFVGFDLELWKWLQPVISVAVMILLFALILRWLPSTPPHFVNALAGAVVAGGLLAALRGGIAYYFSQSSVTTAYGAAVTLVVVLVWIYFTIQIFFFGAETAATLERRRLDRLASAAE